MSNKNKICQCLVIGGGIAGLTAALNLADRGVSVILITKTKLKESNSAYAQGGIAAVLDNKHDTIDYHAKDTIEAGAGLCDSAVVRYIIERAPLAIKWLSGVGVPFTTSSMQNDNVDCIYHLTREGGHSARRVVHAADATGNVVIGTLARKVMEHPQIVLLQDCIAVDLILGDKINKDARRCYGAYVFDKTTNAVITIAADNTILATGGAGKVYLYTSNPDIATGDGVAMASRIGCRIADMEFIQFHPTCLYHPQAKSFLISEAVRGEGGILKLPNGRRFMQDYDPRLELAPRDIVAKAIDYEMKKHGLECVYLDISHKSPQFICEHFPTIYARCAALGIDITANPIPVVPAAHYMCGGIMADVTGKTDVNNLYAIGECASTGFHGANRLASNSLLECLVMGKAVADTITSTPILNSFASIKSDANSKGALPLWDESRVQASDEEVLVAHNWDELRRTMWDYVGIIRTDKRLRCALKRIDLLKEEIHEYYSSFKLSANLLELRNLVTVAELIVKSALLRHESRGGHFSKDYPQTQAVAKRSILSL